MNVAEKFGGTDLRGGHFVHGGFHPFLRLDVGEMELLERAAFGVRGKFTGERGVNVAWHGAVAFDEVGIAAIHRAHEGRDAAARDGLQHATQPFGATEQFQSERGEVTAAVFGQKRLEVGWIIEQSSRGHNLPILLPMLR